MARRIHDLSLSNLDHLPAACRACVFWEVSGAPRGPRAGDEQVAASRKEAWWQATQLEWGTPGKALYVDDVPVGYATFAPAEHFARVRRMRHAVSDDALLLAALWVAPEHREVGMAKMLLQSVLRDVHRRHCRALEAYGTRWSGLGEFSWTCLIPAEFLLANGFEVLHDDPEQPLLRLDLRKTVRWQESVGHALEGVVSALSRRERARAPARPALEAHR
ncbi:MAG: GNAT family N-acetyltransferase [Euzebyales bacterium]|nr:GNAT family N-acetyltransferase [Euzebyales bacterium]